MVLLGVLALWAWAQQSYQPTAILDRKGKEVVATKTSPDSMGLAQIDQITKDGKKLNRFVFYDPGKYLVDVKFGKDTTALAHLAVVEQSGKVGRISLTDGSARQDRQTGQVVVKAKDTPSSVEIRQEHTTAFGSRLDYNNQTGLAVLQGPVSFARAGDKPLSGSSKTLDYSLDTGELTLLGAVELRQQGRVTTADSAIVDDKAGVAFLYGQPVKSLGKGGAIQGTVIRYELDSGDLLVLHNVSGSFETSR